jgi:hypothetical protein
MKYLPHKGFHLFSIAIRYLTIRQEIAEFILMDDLVVPILCWLCNLNVLENGAPELVVQLLHVKRLIGHDGFLSAAGSGTSVRYGALNLPKRYWGALLTLDDSSRHAFTGVFRLCSVRSNRGQSALVVRIVPHVHKCRSNIR